MKNIRDFMNIINESTQVKETKRRKTAVAVESPQIDLREMDRCSLGELVSKYGANATIYYDDYYQNTNVYIVLNSETPLPPGI